MIDRRSHHSLQIVGNGWTLHLPTGNGYEREVLVDHLRSAVQLYGSAGLRWANGTIAITRLSEDDRKRCTSCHGATRNLAGTSGRDLLCLGCICDAPARELAA